LQGSWLGSALFVIPANAGIQKAQMTTMVNPAQTVPDWIPAFAGMTGFGLSESDKNSGNGYIHRRFRIRCSLAANVVLHKKGVARDLLQLLGSCNGVGRKYNRPAAKGDSNAFGSGKAH